MKFCFLDLETTGTDIVLHEVVQISAVFENSETGKTADRKWDVRPRKADCPATYDQGALEITGMTVDQIKGFPDPDAVYTSVSDTFKRSVDKYNPKDKMFFVGYFSKFDYDFLREWFRLSGDEFFGSYFWYPYIDVAQIAALALMSVRHKMKDFKLATVCRELGVEVDTSQTHDSLYDAKLCWRLYHGLVDGGEGE
jgi:DNA polymerase III epsilon subunit-like protein